MPVVEHAPVKEWKFDFSQWNKLGTVRRFSRAAKSGDMDAMIEIMTGMITSWAYDPDPTNADEYDDLTMDQWKEVQGKVTSAVSDFFQSAK